MSELATNYPQWWPVVVGWAAKRCADPEGIAAEAFARAVVVEQAGQAIKRAFVFKVAWHLILDQARHERLREVGALPPYLAAPADVVDEGEQDDAEAKLLTGLTASQRAIVLLRRDGYSLREGAERLGVSYAAAQHLALRARQHVARQR